MNVQNFRYMTFFYRFGNWWIPTHIAQNIVETSQKYFQSFIAIEIFSQNLCEILQNISLQNYNFNFLKYFCEQINT